MRVLHVIPSLDQADGGPTQMILGVCRSLLAGNHAQAEIATTVPAGQHEGLAASLPAGNGVPVRTFPRTFSRAWKYSRALGQWLSDHAADYDVVHAHSVFSYATGAACRAAFRVGVPTVVTPHGMLAPFSRRHKFLRKFVYWHLVEKHSLAQAGCVHASTPAEQVELERFLPGLRVDCIALGMDATAWDHPASRGEFRRRCGIPEDCKLLLYLSRIHSKKGLLDALLPAMALLRADVHLAIVGESDVSEPLLERRAKSLAESLGLGERVTFAGPIYGEAKWAAYDDADLYVLPSIHENFGITVIEAMARGTPCVVSPGVQSGQYVREAECGRIVSRAPEALAAALTDLLAAPPDRRADIGRRGREFVQRELTWARTARGLADVYQDLIQSKARSPSLAGPSRDSKSRSCHSRGQDAGQES